MEDPAQTHPVHASLQQLDELSKSSQLTDLNPEIDDQHRRTQPGNLRGIVRGRIGLAWTSGAKAHRDEC